MNRRDFLMRSAGAMALVATPTAVLAHARGSLLEDPQAWVGTRFDAANGARLELAGVEGQCSDGHCSRFSLRFRTLSGTVPEGTYHLAGAHGEELLYLQAGQAGPVAHVSRLRSTHGPAHGGRRDAREHRRLPSAHGSA